MRLVIFVGICLIAVGPGCRSNPKDPTEAAAKKEAKADKKNLPSPKQKQARASLFTNTPPAAPTDRPITGNVSGRVLQVDDKLRFIVIDFGTSRMPQLEQKLNVYRLDQKVAEVKISGPFRNTTAAADITAGEVKYGDFVKVE